jgi:hypothetical protein
MFFDYFGLNPNKGGVADPDWIENYWISTSKYRNKTGMAQRRQNLIKKISKFEELDFFS